MGVLAPGSAHTKPSAQPPIAMSVNFLTHVSAELQTSPPTTQKLYLKFQNPRTNFENTPLRPPKYSIVRGIGEVPNFFLFIGIIRFE